MADARKNFEKLLAFTADFNSHHFYREDLLIRSLRTVARGDAQNLATERKFDPQAYPQILFEYPGFSLSTFLPPECVRYYLRCFYREYFREYLETIADSDAVLERLIDGMMILFTMGYEDELPVQLNLATFVRRTGELEARLGKF